MEEILKPFLQIIENSRQNGKQYSKEEELTPQIKAELLRSATEIYLASNQFKNDLTSSQYDYYGLDFSDKLSKLIRKK